MNVWFDDFKKEHVCEETGKEIVLCKDKKGRVIGFEKLNFVLPKVRKKAIKALPVEVVVS